MTDETPPKPKRKPGNPDPNIGAKMRAARTGTAHQGARRKTANGLTECEQLFVRHYIGAARFNGTEAMMLAGGHKSRNGARNRAYILLRKEAVVAEIERLTAERNERLQITADDIMRDLVVLRTDGEMLFQKDKSTHTLKARLDIVKTLGEHVNVGAFRRQIGLSNPNGGPIETVDLATLAQLSDEELEIVERARAILDRVTGKPAAPADNGADQGGEGAAPEGD